MDEIDELVSRALKEMGCNPNKPPHWIRNVHKIKDQTTGELIKEIPHGYLCSRCGKHSWFKDEICDGCDSIMKGM